MTNAEYFLKDNVSVDKLIIEFADFKPKLETSDNIFAQLGEFFYTDTKPTLTEDERVILRNIPKEFTTIARNLVGELSARNKDTWRYADVFNHLFQFIKERRRIFY